MTRYLIPLVLISVLGACSKRVISLEGLACTGDEDCLDGWTCNPVDGVCEQAGACAETGTLTDCSRCGDNCSALDHVTAATCEPDGAGFICVIGECEPGWIDANGEPGNGCEEACTATGTETCDGTDNDCDGVVDNGFNLGSDCGSDECAGGVIVCRADGTGATCSTDGVACGDGECNECDGGTCGESPVGEPGPGCDAAAAGVCDFADTCDTGGVCNANIASIGDPCGDGECNECDDTGACVETAAGTPGPGCNDVTNDECTAPDSCLAGGTCERNDTADGTPCADGECNECAAGACVDSPVGSPGPGCDDANDDDCDNPDTCAPGGTCNANFEADATACGDGECNQCSAGTCIDSPNNQPGPGCSGSLSACAGVETCDNGSCTSADAPNNTPCDADGDGNSCDDSCQNGVCVLDDQAGNGRRCSDGTFCNGTESCDNGTCGNSTGDPCAVNVGDADDDCSESCNEGAGDCTADDPNDSDCDNGAFCDGTETCTNGSCGNSTGDPCLARVGDADDDCSESCDEGNNDCTASDPAGSFCDNDTFCDGTESCDGGTCGNSTGNPCPGDNTGPDCDDSCDEGANDCTGNDAGSTPCDDGVFCNGDETCSGGTCGGSDGNPCPGHDVPPSCNDSCNEAADNCLGNDADASLCDDGTFCNGTETCTNGTCGDSSGNPCPGDNAAPDCDDSCNETDDDCTADDANGTGCDDGTFCNGAEACLNGACGGLSSGPPCSGHNQGPDCDDSCNETDDDCTGFDAAGTSCDDGVACTLAPDTCDDAGVCGGGAFDDTYCDDIVAGDLCWPPCSSDASGCVTPPTSMSLSCTSPVQVAETSSCTATLTGGDNSGQAACMPCSAEVGVKEIGFTDFDDGSGSCGLDGWTVVGDSGGDFCYNNNSCPMDNSNGRACCPTDYCPADGINNELAFQADRRDCDSRQWRLQNTFDTRGLTDIRVCFDYAGTGAEGGNEVLQIDIDNGITTTANIFCDEDGPRELLDDTWVHQCVDLPAQADDRAALTVIFFLHSDTNDDHIAIDNIRVSGWGGGCTKDIVEFASNFNGCNYAAWNATGPDTPTCQTECDGTDNLWAANDSWTITRSFDASAFDGQVELCFDAYEDNADNNEHFDVEFRTDGINWQTAWSKTGTLGSNGTCSQICVNLSAIDPAVHNNPSLGVRFSLESTSNDEILALDNVVLRGARYCAVDAGVVSLSAPGEVGVGLYSFTASDTYGEPLAADISCYWEPDPNLAGQDSVSFDP